MDCKRTALQERKKRAEKDGDGRLKEAQDLVASIKTLEDIPAALPKLEELQRLPQEPPSNTTTEIGYLLSALRSIRQNYEDISAASPRGSDSLHSKAALTLTWVWAIRRNWWALSPISCCFSRFRRRFGLTEATRLSRKRIWDRSG